jgi:hypothetical protein
MRKQPAGPSSGVLIKAAMEYGRLGWSVVPAEPRGEKSSIRWQIYQHRRPEMTEIGDWFNRLPCANLAVVTGIVSALVVLDLDPRRGSTSSLKRLEQEHGPLPATVEAVMGARRQLYFGHPGEIVPERPDFAPGIDLHGDGGYVLAPPSEHASGDAYRWVHSPEVFHLEKLPPWLASVPSARANPKNPWRHLLRTGVAEGGRSEAVSTLAGHLLGCEVDPEAVLELMLCWNAVRCHPPLAADKVADTVESIARAGREDTAPKS